MTLLYPFVFVCNTLMERPGCSTLICSLMPTRLKSTLKPPTCSNTPTGASVDIREVWASDPLFYPAKPPAHWLMVAEVAGGTVLMVPLAPSRDGDPTRCRPIGCYPASEHLADQYRRDR